MLLCCKKLGQYGNDVHPLQNAFVLQQTRNHVLIPIKTSADDLSKSVQDLINSNVHFPRDLRIQAHKDL